MTAYTRTMLLRVHYGAPVYNRCAVHPNAGGLKLTNNCPGCREFHDSFVGHPKDKEKGR